MKPLHMSSTGEYLYHATRGDEVDAWQIGSGARIATFPGAWIGMSNDGRSVLTLTPAGPKAWDTATQTEIDPLRLTPDRFPFHQSTYATSNRYPLELELRDALGREPARMLHIEHDPRYMPGVDNWAFSPDDTSVVMTMSGTVAGQGWALGLCIDLQQAARRFKFKVNRFHSSLPINFSPDQPFLLVSDEMYHLAVVEMESGKVLRRVWLNGFANVASALPGNPWLLAVNAWEIGSGVHAAPFTIQMINLEHMSGERGQRPRVEAVFIEPEAVIDVLCAPDGLHMASLLASGTIHWRNLVSGKVEQIFENDEVIPQPEVKETRI